MRRWRGIIVAAAMAAAFGRAPEAASQGKAPPDEYNIDRSQSVQNAPGGYVGRKTTDRERRVGKEKQTGRVVNYELTFGGFARRCPTAEGIVEGDFEYTLNYVEVVAADGATRETLDVELALRGSRVAHAHGRRGFIPREPGKLPFRQAPFARDAVHDLHLPGAAGHRAHQPFAPDARFLVEAGVQEREQRERGVAQPAVAIVPVAHPAQALGKRGRRRRYDAAGRRVGERLERNERAAHGGRPRAGRGTTAGPIAPVPLGLAERTARIDRLRDLQVRRAVGQDEREGLSRLDLEARARPHVAVLERHRRAQHDLVRPRDRADAPALGEPGDPRDRAAVVEAQDELHFHGDAPAPADDRAHEVRLRAANRHEIDQRDRARIGFPFGLEDERIGTVTPLRLDSLRRGELPPAVLGRAEERGEARGRVETRQAQPVDRAVAPHQRSALAVADQRIVLDPRVPHTRRTARAGG